MGLIISRFRKKQSTKDILEKIQNDIISIEEYSTHTQARQKRLVGSLVLYSIILCLVSLVVCYFYYLPTTLQDHLILAGAFFGFVLLVYILKRFLTWWYRRKLSRNEAKLSEFKEKKEKILEQVMETETYKVAKEILEKYAPEQLRKSLYGKSPVAPTPSGAVPRMPTPSSGSDVRRRIVPAAGPGNQMVVKPAAPIGQQAIVSQSPNLHRPVVTPQLQGAPRPGGPSAGRISSPAPNSAQHPGPPGSGPPSGPLATSGPPMPLQGHPSGPPPGHHAFVTHPLSRAGGAPPGPPMPRPVLPRERGYLDRFIEYLVGDGPANRFALVCRQCESHNGMALKEEFEYLAFRCAYCYYWNPSRKQRPSAPRLETLAIPPPPPPPRLQGPQEEEETEEENVESSSGEEEEEEEEGGQEEESGSSSEDDDEEDEEEEEEEGRQSSSELSSNKATSSHEGSLEDMGKSGVSSETSSLSPSEEGTGEGRAPLGEVLPHQTFNGTPSDTTDSTSTSTTPSSPEEHQHNVQ